MIEISEITGRDTLKQWLDERPQETGAEKEALRLFCVWLAQRGAMRVFPLFGKGSGTDDSDLTISVLRSLITSGVAHKYPSTTIQTTASKATLGFVFYDTVIEAISAAASVVEASSAAKAVHAAAEATDAAFSAEAVYIADYAAHVRRSVQEDCELFSMVAKQDRVSVWQVDNPFAHIWKDGREWMLAQYDDNADMRVRSTPNGVDYRFWVDWYDAAMAGKHLNWDMQHEIVLIEDDVWQGDPSVLMNRINGIWRSYVLKGSANAERLVRDAETELITSVPETELSDVLCENAIHQMERALKRLRRAENEIGGSPLFRDDLFEVEDRLANERDRMISLHDAAIDFYLNTRELIEAGSVQSDNAVLNTALRDFERSASEFQGGDAKVRQVLAARAAARIERVSLEDTENRALLNATRMQSLMPRWRRRIAKTLAF